MSDVKGSTSSITDSSALHKELDEASCPICMDHPHNAVLLLCTAHEKGCRSFICDTSYRHSNCLDRFKKLRASHSSGQSHENTSAATDRTESSGIGLLPDSSSNVTNELTEVQATVEIQDLQNHSDYGNGSLVQTSGTAPGQVNSSTYTPTGRSLQDASLNLTCPLCRGAVSGWKIEKEARQYLDLKQRSCSHESCSFIGNYQELRRHARRAHPTKCPADVDPSRQRAWQNLEHQRDYGDIMSVIRSSMPNAVVFGDYVIENEDTRDPQSSWWSTFVLFQMVNRNTSRRGLPQNRQRSRPWTRQRHLSRDFTNRRHQWGEGSSRLRVEEDNSWNRSSRRSDQDPSPRPRRRRRFSNSRPEENGQ